MNYYDEVNSYVKKVEIGKAIRETNANRELVECYWNVGRLIVEAQGGKEKSTYKNELLKDWSAKLTKEFGKGYDYTNLSRFRQLYLYFPMIGPVAQQLTWTNICKILKNLSSYFFKYHSLLIFTFVAYSTKNKKNADQRTRP